MDPIPDDPNVYAAILRDAVELNEQAERKKRRLDYGKLRDEDYTAIEDAVLLKAIDALLGRVYNRDNEDYRKGRIHLSRLAWKLGEKLRENL